MLLAAAAGFALASGCSGTTPAAPSTTSPQSSTQALAISAQPQSQTIVSGAHATLTVAATGGTGGLSYQWYTGPSGAMSAPMPGATAASFATPALTATTDYWVRVSDGSGAVNSATATIKVSPPPGSSGTAPSINEQPESASIASGQTTTLSVDAGGTPPLNYQWYAGSSGSTASPIGGAAAADFTTPALTATTSYWVRVSNAYGSTDSSTATVTVTAPAGVAPAITGQPQSQSVPSGHSATLSVVASGTAPLGYQWYAGSSGATSNPIGGATSSSFTTPALGSTASYWVRVSNAYGSVDSATATVTVAADPATAAYENEVVTLLNQHRAAGATCGGTPYPAVGPLYMNANLQAAAHDHSVDMATNDYFSHTSLDGRTFDQRIVDAGYTGAYPLAENIAAGQSTPQAVVDAWMASPPHCENIMLGSLHAVGVGYAFSAGSTYRYYWTLDFGGS